MKRDTADKSYRIIVVDDDETLRQNIAEILRENGHVIFHAATGTDALHILANEEIDLIMTDIFMPDMDGIELIRNIRLANDETRILAMSGYEGDVDYLEIAGILGAAPILRKPFRQSEMLAAIRNAFD